MSLETQPLDILIIGAGQAGLAMGYHLRQTPYRFQRTPPSLSAARLAHLRRTFGSDDDDEPLVTGLAERVAVLAEVLLGHRVDERHVRVRLDPLDRAAYLQLLKAIPTTLRKKIG